MMTAATLPNPRQKPARRPAARETPRGARSDADGTNGSIQPTSRRIPDATYRLQFNRAFAFRDARRIVPYLDDLGISDLYASPFFRARADSTHGYDIADHNSLNPAIGSEADFALLVRAFQQRGMGLLVDFVPNHMGIGEPANAWWMDVLENGPASLYADFFDIDWRPLKPELRDNVLLPILGDQYGVVLENGELRLLYEDGTFRVRYYEHQLPVAPHTWTQILRGAVSSLLAAFGEEPEDALELQSIVTGLAHLPAPTQTSRERRRERAREKEILKRRLTTLVAQSALVRRALFDAVAAYNGTPGDAASFDALDALLSLQPYRLSYWRTAGEEINYRRFFDVNDLAGIRVEHPAVFEASHRLLLRLLREGAVTGVRLDHPDGLWDPAGYVARLQERYLVERHRDERDAATSDAVALERTLVDEYRAALAGDARSDAARPLYVLVEKILSGRERLPERWPVDGTTGYDFANAVNGIFVDRANRRAIDTVYNRFTRSEIEFSDLVYEKKKLVLATALAGDLNVLAWQLAKIKEQSRRHRDFTLNAITAALREVIAAFPIYRTYINEDGLVDRHDRAAIDAAITRARRRNPALEPTVFDFLRTVLLLQASADGHGADAEAQLAFVMKFQQMTGPVMAKGMEDSAFYIYNRLISLNEVGGEPDQFGMSVPAFHRLNAERAARWPHTLLATSTHDTKRSEDVRARINVLSEVPRDWNDALERWRVLNRPQKAILADRVAPDRNEEYLLYQTLLGAWPLEAMDAAAYATFKERIAAAMLKAAKEAKVNTSWINPNEEHEDAVQRFVHQILGETPASPFVQAMLPLQVVVARFGAYNALAQTLVKLTAPGVPDLYQGNELWDFSLVDPDNRRPVDYRRRARLLRNLLAAIARAGDDLAPLCRRLLASWQDGRCKLYLTQRTLSLRRTRPALFREGAYLPLAITGTHADHVFAFARVLDGATVITVVPRLLTSITSTRGHPLGESVWGDTTVHLPDSLAGRYRHRFSGATLEAEACAEGAILPLADILREFPVGLLENLP